MLKISAQSISIPCSAILLATLAACSSAGWEGYGPVGEGFVGSAYGYADDRLGNETWQVQYRGAIASDALSGARRRAKELCSGIGVSAVDFNPEISSTGGIIIASGTATCTDEIESENRTETAILIEKRDSLRAEIQAQEQQLADARASTWTGPIVAAGVRAMTPAMENKISELRGKLSSVERKLSAAQREERTASRSTQYGTTSINSGSLPGNASSGGAGGGAPARCGFGDIEAVRSDYNAEVDVQRRGGQMEPSLLESFDEASARARGEAVDAYQATGESPTEFVRLSELQIEALFNTRDQALQSANTLGSPGTVADCSPQSTSASGATTCLASSTFIAAVQVAFYCDEISKKARNGDL